MDRKADREIYPRYPRNSKRSAKNVVASDCSATSENMNNGDDGRSGETTQGANRFAEIGSPKRRGGAAMVGTNGGRPLDTEIAAYEKQAAQLETSHAGKWAVFKGAELIAIHGTFDAAAADAVNQFGRGPFLIRQIGAPPIVRALRFAVFGALLGLTLGACTTAQVATADRYQAEIAGACSVAMTLAPIAGPVAPWIVGGCATEAAIAKLALDPSSLAWLQGLVAKAA